MCLFMQCHTNIFPHDFLHALIVQLFPWNANKKIYIDILEPLVEHVKDGYNIFFLILMEQIFILIKYFI